MRADDFLNEEEDKSAREKALAAAMANINKLKSEIEAKNAEVRKANAEQPKPSLPKYDEDEYKQRLRFHDWYYNYSDDHGVFTKGSRERDLLNRMQDALDKNYEIWNKFAPEMFQRK